MEVERKVFIKITRRLKETKQNIDPYTSDNADLEEVLNRSPGHEKAYKTND